jgi:glycosyltransferase involved in cell wall biosynthesis
MLFTHWAVAPPEAGRRAVDYIPEGQYVCCIGRNNRDLFTFVEAVRKTGIDAILICRPGQADGLDLPDNLSLRTDVPLAECQEVMERAMATVVPLIDDTTGAGHMTVVTSLLYGTPVIATDSPVLVDYVLEDKTGFLVEHGSSEALAAAINRLKGDPKLRERLRASSRAFAREHLTEDSAAEFLRRTLDDHLPQSNQD